MPIYGLPFTDTQLFDLQNIVLPAWILLAVAPRWRFTTVVTTACTLILSALYAALVATAMATGKGESLSNVTSFEGVKQLLSNEAIVLPAWIHYAAFDLWTGRWIAGDAASRAMPRLLVAPILFTTIMLGPAGLVLYFLLRLPFKAGKGAKGKTA